MEQDNNTKGQDLRLINIEEACRRLNIGRWSIYQLINKNVIKTVKIGTRRLISTKTLNDYIMSLEIEYGTQS